MKTIKTIAELKAELATRKTAGQRIAFVPTMGALHDGHLTLVDLAKKNAACVVVSIFVNPTQFAPNEDFSSYPRHADKDAKLLETRGADILFLPSENEIYPHGQISTVKAGAAAFGLESEFRPHFFDGVVNVVHRLFEAVEPDVAIFGEKDWQQLCVVREMVVAQNMPIEIIGAKIARDEEGLALSSRNAYLTPGEIEIARQLNKTLRAVADKIKNGQDAESVITAAANVLLTIGFDKVDYIAQRDGRVLGAVWLGKTRLIDNMAIACEQH